MTVPEWPESAYQRAIAVLAATCPGACPVETQRAWRLKLAAKRLDPVVVMAAVDTLTDTVARPSFADLLQACRDQLRAAQYGPGKAEPGREIAANASHDPLWSAAGLEVTRRVLRRSVRADDFEREHRAEYERLRAAKEEMSDG